MNNRYVKLRIPFASKAYIWKKDNGFKIKGNAFYIFDIKTKKYIDEYIQIIESNFRITDKAMIKPTEYYKNKKVRHFRSNFLDILVNKNPLDIDKEEYFNLNKDSIMQINKYFKNENTTNRTLYSYLSGSNFTGAEQNYKATQMLCIDNWFFGCNFTNVLNHYKPKKSEKRKIDDTNIKTLTLKDFIEKDLITNFSNKFFQYNRDFQYIENFPDNIILEENNNQVNYKYEANIEIINKFEIKENQKNFIAAYLNKTIDNYNEFENNINKLKQKLRSFYISNIQKCIKDNLIPLHHTINKNNLTQVENAHIISFSSLIKNKKFEDFIKAIDPFNCLRIDSSYHKMFDKNEIRFDKDGYVINVKNNKKLKKYLDIKLINKNLKTKEYFEKYLEESKKMKINLKCHI